MPDLAATWQTSPDGLEYTFRLKNGVKWHDGKAFTSEDVKSSLDRIREPPKGVRSPRQGALQPVAQVNAPAVDTVTVRLNYASASLASNVATDWFAILPKHVLEAKGDMKRDIIGTGPFKFKGYTPGTTHEDVRNTGYFVKDRPYLDGIRLYLVKDDATRFAALRTARVVYLPYPYGVSPAQAGVARADTNLVVQSNFQPTLHHFRMNLEKAPWSDPRVRKAASLGIDRQAFIKAVFAGSAILGVQMSSAGPWGIPEDELLKMPGYRQPKEVDIAEAKKLLAQAGFADGFKTSILTRSEEQHQRRGTFVAAELAKLGIKAELVVKAAATYDDTLMRGAFDAHTHGTATALEDPDLRYGENYVTGGGRNYGKYTNLRIDELYEKQSRALDVAERKKIVREMLMILNQDNPDVPLAWSLTQIAHTKQVRNYKMASSNQINNKHQEVWLAE
ncbi:MAG: hypothetical protein HYX92_04685 [Chloroflexi bacterium]|nr:hypothetical protein [Chloroflexota bacterium]